MHTHAHTHILAQIDTSAHTDMQTQTCGYRHTHMQTHTCVHIHTETIIYIYPPKLTSTHAHIHVHTIHTYISGLEVATSLMVHL